MRVCDCSSLLVLAQAKMGVYAKPYLSKFKNGFVCNLHIGAKSPLRCMGKRICFGMDSAGASQCQELLVQTQEQTWVAVTDEYP